ncbi:hypothetical protein AB0K00_18210 [Dactylosporangium sp. NPDC049525]|uniref:hypothetical protein n=1 Tax=Dactylosporangium sp. NPDC049525 TaxID=3154730 RepID=UPI00341563CD
MAYQLDTRLAAVPTVARVYAAGFGVSAEVEMLGQVAEGHGDPRVVTVEDPVVGAGRDEAAKLPGQPAGLFTDLRRPLGERTGLLPGEPQRGLRSGPERGAGREFRDAAFVEREAALDRAQRGHQLLPGLQPAGPGCSASNNTYPGGGVIVTAMLILQSRR